MSKYLVTGAAGFIGAKVCEQLIASGHTVVGIDNLNDYYDVRLKDFRVARLLAENWAPSSSNRESIFRPSTPYCSGNFEFRFIDIERLSDLVRLFEVHRFDAVIHLAGRAGVRYSLENPHIYVTTNVHGTLNILECQRRYGVMKHVLASTSSVYAGATPPFNEDLAVNTPLSPYAATKKAAEMMAYSYHKLYRIDVTVLRYFTVFGPSGRPDMSYFRFIKAIAEGREFEVHGDGTQTRDFTYVDDIARGTILALKSVHYAVVNLGGGRRPQSINGIIAIMQRAIGRNAKIRWTDFHSADMVETAADIGRARAILGWTPEITVEQGLIECVQWYRNNAAWLRAIDL